jgi:serine/threonine-protein kinase 24/25/MST4
MRLFRRVPSDGSASGQQGRPASPDDVFCDENAHPTAPAPVEPYGKEAILGRRLYTKAVEPTLAELHAQTSAMQKREALAKLSDAFATLDAVDPEGAYHLMSSLISSASQDNKLNAAFLRKPAQKVPDDGTPQGTVIIKSPTPASVSPAKLILSSNNPHWKSHRRRQTTESSIPIMNEKDYEQTALEAKYPGREPVSGMEHCKQLSDVLYGRWADGLRIRWPAI